jgi:hypothetical protein
MRAESVLPDGMMYGYRTALGEIRLVIEGEVSNISIEANSSLFMKSPDFIVLPESTTVKPSVITGYYDKFDEFKMYSTYERRFGRKYKGTNVKIENVVLNLYNPRYDYNLGKCWMDGDCHFEIIVPANKVRQSNVQVSPYPTTQYPNDADIRLYPSYTGPRMVFDLTHVFEFDTEVGDLTPTTYTFDAAEYSNGIIEGVISCTFDGCIDDRISEQKDGAVRDIRISIDEITDTPLRGVYAALYDIDDVYDMTKNNKCKTLVDHGITSFAVKNKNTYPMLDDDGSYYRSDSVQVEIKFDSSRDFTVKSADTFYLNITLDKDANLNHEDMVFKVQKTFDSGEYIDGTITIGVVDSQYKVIDADLIYYTGWMLIGDEVNFTHVETFSDVTGLAILEPSVIVSMPGREFDLYVHFVNVNFGFFDIGGLQRI